MSSFSTLSNCTFRLCACSCWPAGSPKPAWFVVAPALLAGVAEVAPIADWSHWLSKPNEASWLQAQLE